MTISAVSSSSRTHSSSQSCQSDWETRPADILKMTQWDTLRERRQSHTTVMMHKVMNNEVPVCLTEAFTRESLESQSQQI